MRGYEKGTDVPGELVKVRHAFARAAAAIWATYDSDQAWQYAADLGDLIRELETDTATLRARVAADIRHSEDLTVRQLAVRLNMSSGRAGKLVQAGEREGVSMTTNTDDMPVQPAVALAVITSDRGILIEDRADKIPPVTFPGGEVNAGESAAAAATRRTLAETGITITTTGEIGRRIHPRTLRTMFYIAATVNGSLDAQLLDTDDLTGVRWVSIEETRALMPDMYAPVREYLDNA